MVNVRAPLGIALLPILLAQMLCACRPGVRRGTSPDHADPLVGRWRTADAVDHVEFRKDRDYISSMFELSGVWTRETVDVVSLSMGDRADPETVRAEVDGDTLKLTWFEDTACRSTVMHWEGPSK